MAMFAFQLPDALAAKFDAIAGAGRSKRLRDLVSEAVGQAPTSRPAGVRGRSTKLTLRLKDDDHAALDAAAEVDGLLRTEWAMAVLRRRLHGRPKFGRREELALFAVQEELRRIGVNLNQIARALNTAVMPGSVLDAEIRQLEAFRSEIRAHIGGLKAAFSGNLDYWEGDS